MQRDALSTKQLLIQKNVNTKVVHIEIPVNLHVHHHEHTVDYEQETYVYDYNVNFSSSKSTSHETKTLPTQHVVGTVTVKETVTAAPPASCNGCPPKVNAPAVVNAPAKVNAPVVVNAPVDNGCGVKHNCEMVFPSNNDFAYEMKGFINDNCNSCAFTYVNNGDMVLVRGGRVINRIRRALMRTFPRAADFRRANRQARRAFFRNCLR